MRKNDYLVLTAGLIVIISLLILKYSGEKPIEQLISFLTLVATGGLFISTYALWGTTRDLVEGADRTAKNQLRAYVFIKDATLDTIGIGHHPTVNITFKNSGQTPAYRLRSVCQIDFKQIPPMSTAFASKESDAALDLGSGAESFKSVTWRGVMDPTMFEDIQLRRGALFVWGRLDYVDAFGRDQFMQYRLHYRGRSIHNLPILEPHSEGNTAS